MEKVKHLCFLFAGIEWQDSLIPYIVSVLRALSLIMDADAETTSPAR